MEKNKKEIVEIGIIGGTGIYDVNIFNDIYQKKIHTPYGSPSDVVIIGSIKEKKIAFIPRHGKNHTIPPHKINNRANIWALKELGVNCILAPSAVGSLRKTLAPGDLVIPDQFIDRTKLRNDTFYEGGRVCHISSADPFCPVMRTLASRIAKDLGLKVHENGVYVCIEGPRFSTRAESKMFRTFGADVIGMTLFPECILAREMEICYVNLSMITDYDVWSEKPVSVDNVLNILKINSKKIKELITQIIPKIQKERSCSCKNVLSEAFV
jgi:5'-methylthioadenosine phosphorylase